MLGQRISVKEGNEADQQYLKLINDIVPHYEEKFLSYNKFTDRLDSFYAEFLCTKEYEALWKIFILVFCLFHGQSAVERGFNTNDAFTVVNQSEFSLVALRMIHDHMRAKDVAPHSMKITTELRKSVGDAWRHSDAFSKQNREKKTVTEREKKRKLVADEIQEVQEKRKCLLTAVKGLSKDADKAALNAGAKKDFQLLERLNDFRSLIKQKMNKVEELDKMEQDLVARKESII